MTGYELLSLALLGILAWVGLTGVALATMETVNIVSALAPYYLEQVWQII